MPTTSISVGVSIFLVKLLDKLTVGLSVHHNSSPTIAVRTGRGNNIVKCTLSDHWALGGESSRLLREGTGRCQEGCKTEESHVVYTRCEDERVRVACDRF